MQFRLIYEGQLRGQATKDEAKHWIRMHLHPQLEQLWHQVPLVHRREFLRFQGGPNETGVYEHVSGVTFCPIVTERLRLVAGLHVLLFRREEPGHLLSQSGDIDNRVKVLVDALRVPSVDEVRRANIDPATAPNPIHCVLKDDTLLTSVAVETERLLTNGKIEEVLAVITITVKATSLTFDNMGISA
jgi:hypothetical protein